MVFLDKLMQEQMKRAKRKTKELKCYLGRVYRDAIRKAKVFFGISVGDLSLFTLVDAILQIKAIEVTL
jgi:hypothetical protein